LIEAVEALIFLNSSEKLKHDIWWDNMRVKHDTLGISNTCVVLESSCIEGNLLTHLGDLILIVMREDIELEDSFSNIWGTCKIDLEELCLEVSLLR